MIPLDLTWAGLDLGGVCVCVGGVFGLARCCKQFFLWVEVQIHLKNLVSFLTHLHALY